MESNITRRKEGYFGVKYARFLEEFYPEAWDRFRTRPDHRELFRKYHDHCQYNMAILMGMNCLKKNRFFLLGDFCIIDRTMDEGWCLLPEKTGDSET